MDVQKTVLITGAGGGLGSALVNIFLKNKFKVIATDLSKELISGKSASENLLTLGMDVTFEDEIRNAANMIDRKYGPLDMIISNAGVVDYYALSEAGSEQLRKIFDVNVFGLANLTKHFLPSLIKTSGRLIVIGSESYKVPAPFQPYSVSKQMLEKLYDSISLELSTKHIQTILIRPGAIQTKILQDTVDFNYSLPGSVFKKEFDRFGRSIQKYIGNVSTPEKVAEVIYKAATTARPKRIYHINHNPLVSILSALPKHMRNSAIRRSLK